MKGLVNTMNGVLRCAVLIVCIFLLHSCSSIYLITTDSLAQQLSVVGKDTTAAKPGQNMKNGGAGLVFTVLGGHAYNNGLSQIECTRKNGKKLVLTVNDQTQVRITDSRSGDRTVYYYDSMYLKDSCVYGIRSRILREKGNIPLRYISKIEVLSPASDKVSDQ